MSARSLAAPLVWLRWDDQTGPATRDDHRCGYVARLRLNGPSGGTLPHSSYTTSGDTIPIPLWLGPAIIGNAGLGAVGWLGMLLFRL